MNIYTLNEMILHCFQAQKIHLNNVHLPEIISKQTHISQKVMHHTLTVFETFFPVAHVISQQQQNRRYLHVTQCRYWNVKIHITSNKRRQSIYVSFFISYR